MGSAGWVQGWKWGKQTAVFRSRVDCATLTATLQSSDSDWGLTVQLPGMIGNPG